MSEHEYSQGIMGDGSAILKDGQAMTIEEIVAELIEGQTARTQSNKPKITNEMKAECIGEFEFAITAECGQCLSEGEDEDCETCQGGIVYERKVSVPWDTCKQIYKRMAKFAPSCAQGGQGADPVGFIPSSGLNNLAAGHPAKIYPVEAMPSPFESHALVYTHPQQDPDIQLIQERDYWEEKATELAEDVGKLIGVEVGEHSSANCPVQNAIDAVFRATEYSVQQGRVAEGWLAEFARHMDEQLEKAHDMSGFEPIILHIAQEVIAATPQPKADGNEWMLTETHSGMRISAEGVLGRVRGRLKFGAREMLKHLEAMAECFYSGNVKAVDQFLQTWDLDDKRPQPPKQEGE